MPFLKKVYAGRAAVCTENTVDSIQSAVVSVYTAFLNKNNLKERDIISVHFSVTADLNAGNPATLLRSGGFASTVVLFCSAEPDIKGMPHGIVRLVFYCYARKVPIPVYSGGAEKLRPDLFNHTD